LKDSITKEQYKEAKTVVHTYEQCEREREAHRQARLGEPLVGRFYRYVNQNRNEIQKIWYALKSMRQDGVLETIQYTYEAYVYDDGPHITSFYISKGEILPDSLKGGWYSRLTAKQFLRETKFIRLPLDVYSSDEVYSLK